MWLYIYRVGEFKETDVDTNGNHDLAMTGDDEKGGQTFIMVYFDSS